MTFLLFACATNFMNEHDWMGCFNIVDKSFSHVLLCRSCTLNWWVAITISLNDCAKCELIKQLWKQLFEVIRNVLRLGLCFELLLNKSFVEKWLSSRNSMKFKCIRSLQQWIKYFEFFYMLNEYLVCPYSCPF